MKKELSEECKKFRQEYERRRKNSNYDELDFQNLISNSYKQLGCAILQCALEDADYEFLENDYNEWKKLYKKYEPKSKVSSMNESDFKEEFKCKNNHKQMLCKICEIDEDCYTKDKIPQESIDERAIFENNRLKEIKKIFNNEFAEENLKTKACLRGWKIGKFYKEKEIFDL